MDLLTLLVFLKLFSCYSISWEGGFVSDPCGKGEKLQTVSHSLILS
jgi:hypothetical protein